MPADHQMSAEEVAQAELERLRASHRELDLKIDQLSAEGPAVSSLMLGRLKREKLQLKDQIARLENILTPDIIA